MSEEERRERAWDSVHGQAFRDILPEPELEEEDEDEDDDASTVCVSVQASLNMR